jgi:hypothetical protein
LIAYVFWHWPHEGADRAVYEAAQRAFHVALNRAGGEGFQRSACFRVRGAFWIPAGDGYEDWYLLDGSHALDPLNELAVSAAVRGAHDAAARAATGLGGLYRLMRGVPALAGGEVTWLSKPRGETSDEFSGRLDRGAVVWRRQMVLGPAPEFLVEGALPTERAGTRVSRELIFP